MTRIRRFDHVGIMRVAAIGEVTCAACPGSSGGRAIGARGRACQVWSEPVIERVVDRPEADRLRRRSRLVGALVG